MKNDKEHKVEVDKNEDKSWFINDKSHREDGPAVMLDDDYKYKVPVINENPRNHGPAVMLDDDYKAWFKSGRGKN